MDKVQKVCFKKILSIFSLKDMCAILKSIYMKEKVIMLKQLFKKNNNTLVALLSFASSLIWGFCAEQSAILTLGLLLMGIIFLLDNLNHRYHYLQALVIIIYGGIVYIIRPELWLGSLICILCGIIALIVFTIHHIRKIKGN